MKQERFFCDLRQALTEGCCHQTAKVRPLEGTWDRPKARSRTRVIVRVELHRGAFPDFLVRMYSNNLIMPRSRTCQGVKLACPVGPNVPFEVSFPVALHSSSVSPHVILNCTHIFPSLLHLFRIDFLSFSIAHTAPRPRPVPPRQSCSAPHGHHTAHQYTHQLTQQSHTLAPRSRRRRTQNGQRML